MSNDGSSSSGTSPTGLFLGLASLSAGAYHGFMDSQGIPIEKENLEFALTYGPAIVQAGVYSVITGGIGLIAGGVIGADRGLSFRRRGTLEKIAKGTGGAIAGTAAGATLGGAIGGALGGVQTLIGYGAGYLAGWALK